MLVSLYLSVLYGILYGFFEAFTVVYLEIRGFKTTSYGLTYIALGLGFVAAYAMLATSGRKSVGAICYRSSQLNRAIIRKECQSFRG